MQEENPGDYKACEAGCPKKQGEQLVLVERQERADEERSDPGQGSQDTGLGAMALAVREKGIVHKKGQGDDKEGDNIFFRPSEKFRQTQKHEEIQGGIQEQAVPLVQEVIEKRVCPRPWRNAEDSLLESLGPFRRYRAFIDRKRRDGPIKAEQEIIKKDESENGEHEESKDFRPCSVLLPEEEQSNEKERPKNQVVFQSEPEERREEKPHEEKPAGRKGRGGPHFPENIHREKGNRDFRIKMDGIKKDGRAEGIKKP
jgi:hypothetical protein